MSQAYLSLQRAKDLVVEIVETSPPGARNPQVRNEGGGYGGCLYYDASTGRRCIAGEVLHRAGLPAPDPTANYMGSPDHWHYEEKRYTNRGVLTFLEDIQYVFDHHDKNMGDSAPTWRVALKECRRQGLL